MYLECIQVVKKVRKKLNCAELPKLSTRRVDLHVDRFGKVRYSNKSSAPWNHGSKSSVLRPFLRVQKGIANMQKEKYIMQEQHRVLPRACRC
jgi:hypothetical protein